jgi:CDP-glycerol glycerophosphotransferase (TagB/SpsB family)
MQERAAAPQEELDLASMRWERIQWTLRLRGGVGREPWDGLRLEQAVVGASSPRGRPASFPPTRIERDGRDLIVRFDVMRGPDLLPLTPGRWVLVAGVGAGGRTRTLRVADPTIVDPIRNQAAFQLGRGLFRAVPDIDLATGALVLDVSLDIEVRRAPSDDSVLDRARGLPLLPIRVVRPRLFALLLRAVRLVVRRNGRRVLFTSDSRAELSGNLKLVHDRMIERGLDREYTLMTLFKESVASRRSLHDRLRMPRLLGAADIVVIDDYQPVVSHLGDGEVRIIQLWHASGAFKTVGYSRVGKPGGPSPWSRVHRNYTHAIVSSEHDVPFYAEAFGIPESRVIPTGIPRMDRFFDEGLRAAGRAAALEAYPEIEGRMTILFAPTFRGEGPRTASYDINLIDYAALHALCVERNAVVIMKMHPFVGDAPTIPPEFRDRILDGSRSPIDVNDLLFAVDLLITDYSSIVFEYSILGRPMLFFAYDLEEYVASRDFYVPFEEFVPGRIVRTFPELLDAIRRDDYQIEKVAAFAARHFAHLDGGSTDRVIDQLILAR